MNALRTAGALCLLLGAGVAGCSGPVEPTSVGDPRDVPAPRGYPAGTVLRVVSGEDGRGVGDALVRIAGREHHTDATGELALSEAAPLGATLDIEGLGFLRRQTLVRTLDEITFALWPSVSPTRLDSAYTERLVYTSAALGNTADREALDRPGLEIPFVSLLPDASIRSDALALDNLRASSGEVTDALEGAIVYRVDGPSGSTPVTLAIDPGDETIVDDNLRAFTRCWMNRLVIERCEIVLRSIDVARSPTVLHELGHTFGLNHSPDRSEIMGVRRLRSPSSFSARERLAMKLMLLRRPGNLFPDDDRQATPQRAEGSVSRIVCRQP